MVDGEVLAAAEIERYRREGFLKPSFGLPAEMRDRLRDLADRLIRDNGHLGDEPLASPHVPGSGVQHLKSDPSWIGFPTYEPIVDMIADLIGPDIVLWGTTLFHKAARKGRIVPWHRDGRYWPIKPLATTSVWIAVDDCTVENGCLRCVKGSHLGRDIGRHYRPDRDDIMIPETLEVGEFDESAAVDVELEAGEMVIFDVYTAHGSNANTSDRRRVGYAMRYMPGTSHFDHHDIPVAESPGAAHHTRPLTLIRGRDQTGLNNFTIGHPGPAA
jgi:ectoine hydroxylase-related dioxygenase (phytanoyl-CoA dioxygenase family)